MQPYATDSVSLGSAEGHYDSDMTHSYRLTEGRLIHYPLLQLESVGYQRVNSLIAIVRNLFHIALPSLSNMNPQLIHSHLDRPPGPPSSLFGQPFGQNGPVAISTIFLMLKPSLLRL